MKKMSIIGLLGCILVLPACVICDCNRNDKKPVEQAIEVQETDVTDPTTDITDIIETEEMMPEEDMEASK